MVANNIETGQSTWNTEDDPVGVSEIAKLLNVETTTVSSWRQRHVLPKPDKMINKGNTPIWKTKNIIDWANATGRNRKNISMQDFAQDVDNGTIEEDSLDSFTIKNLEWNG